MIRIVCIFLIIFLNASCNSDSELQEYYRKDDEVSLKFYNELFLISDPFFEKYPVLKEKNLGYKYDAEVINICTAYFSQSHIIDSINSMEDILSQLENLYEENDKDTFQLLDYYRIVRELNVLRDFYESNKGVDEDIIPYVMSDLIWSLNRSNQHYHEQAVIIQERMNARGS